MASLSGLRSPHCHKLWILCSYSSDSTPSLGTSICCKCTPFKKKKKSDIFKGQQQEFGGGVCFFFNLFCLFICLFVHFRATPAAYGSSLDRIGPTDAGLCHSHSNARSPIPSGTLCRVLNPLNHQENSQELAFITLYFS